MASKADRALEVLRKGGNLSAKAALTALETQNKRIERFRQATLSEQAAMAKDAIQRVVVGGVVAVGAGALTGALDAVLADDEGMVEIPIINIKVPTGLIPAAAGAAGVALDVEGGAELMVSGLSIASYQVTRKVVGTYAMSDAGE